jgi:hypothetical protein
VSNTRQFASEAFLDTVRVFEVGLTGMEVQKCRKSEVVISRKMQLMLQVSTPRRVIALPVPP